MAADCDEVAEYWDEGDEVEVIWNGAWKPAKVSRYAGHSRWFVRFPDGGGGLFHLDDVRTRIDGPPPTRGEGGRREG